MKTIIDFFQSRIDFFLYLSTCWQCTDFDKACHFVCKWYLTVLARITLSTYRKSRSHRITCPIPTTVARALSERPRRADRKATPSSLCHTIAFYETPHRLHVKTAIHGFRLRDITFLRRILYTYLHIHIFNALLCIINKYNATVQTVCYGIAC